MYLSVRLPVRGGTAKIDRRPSAVDLAVDDRLREIDCRWSIEGEKGKRRRGGRRKKYLVPSSLARRPRLWVVRVSSSPASRLQFRPVLPDTGGTYRSARLPVCGLPATGRFRQKSTVGGRLKKKSIVGGRLKKKSTVGDRLRKKKGRRGNRKKKKRGRKNTSPARRPRPPAVAARGSPARRCCPRPRPLFLLCEETERLPMRGDRSRRRFPYRPIPPGTGGTYLSIRLPVQGPPATRRYRQNRPSGKKREEEEEKKKEYLALSLLARRRRPRVVVACGSPKCRRRPPPRAVTALGIRKLMGAASDGHRLPFLSSTWLIYLVFLPPNPSNTSTTSPSSASPPSLPSAGQGGSRGATPASREETEPTRPTSTLLGVERHPEATSRAAHVIREPRELCNHLRVCSSSWRLQLVPQYPTGGGLGNQKEGAVLAR
ncbi:hypothetical protein GW17_00046002 [Ensete ventricosum]|nr:hypothetical protein GW17_00046002 [Ensete ventricosum]